jgi:hypothetical protein
MTILMTFVVGVVVHFAAERTAMWFRGEQTVEKKASAMRVAPA